MSIPEIWSSSLLRPGDVAEAFGVTTSTVNTWVREGHLTPVLVTPGGHRRFAPGQVQDLMAATHQDQGGGDT
ncbi:excisionase family DNA binding protein [Haloactinospora alba]|uniref:Excisionase family DNA binding protein n=1 Tax=Haloactinospora alba TaxID=405555 RepID=A0A543NNI6_9ACTN|nr:MerR family DNA-binding transcriptional regulator [Haloactinospora alba]TQN33398.1 excisionase family DNA binding protein [Haloactinospora alba]